MATSSYPIILTDLATARCVVVGGGQVAERKVAGLIAAGARPLVISPVLTPTLAAWRDAGQLDQLPRRFKEDDLAGAVLVIAATDERATNARIAVEARRCGVLVNVADDPGAGSFHTVATLRRGALLITVSTGGSSPALAARLRSELAGRYGPEYTRVLSFAAALRDLPESRLPGALRNALLAWLCSEQALGWLREGSDDLVAAVIQGALGPQRAEVAA